MRPVDVFHIGPQKSGTTWVYECLREHPAVGLPPRDSIHYFDMHYGRGRDWYAGHFAECAPDALLVDPTPSYLRSPYAPARVARENPRARIVVCLRHPVDRAFSHYWHEKKKRRFDFDFAELLDNYDLWSNWLESGFYSRFLERWLDHFPREQLLVQVFDDLGRSPREFLDAILVFLGLEPGFEPSVLNQRVNPAKPPEALAKVRTKRALERVGLLRAAVGVKGALRSAGVVKDGGNGHGPPAPMERLADVDPAVVALLREICAPEIERVERLTGVDLAAWRRDG